MTVVQPLNFTTKAAEAIMGFAEAADPIDGAGFRFIAEKLRAAQVFVLPDYGSIFDRSKPKPEVPGLVFRPPFPVVALEYLAPPEAGRFTPGFTELGSSRRIALAWDWHNEELPDAMLPMAAALGLGPGVAICSISYIDQVGQWTPTSAAAHVAYDAEWMEQPAQKGPLMQAFIDGGSVSKAVQAGKGMPLRLVPLLQRTMADWMNKIGPARLADSVQHDLTDEINAYADTCYALSCGNVEYERHPAPAKLNSARLKAGKLPFPDHHVLTLKGGGAMGGAGEGGPGVRTHLRRGHIRRLAHLGPDRLTWVNATTVRGRGEGEVAKTYAIERRDA